METEERERLDELEETMLARAFLYEAPEAYREAVETVFDAVRAALEGSTIAA